MVQFHRVHKQVAFISEKIMNKKKLAVTNICYILFHIIINFIWKITVMREMLHDSYSSVSSSVVSELSIIYYIKLSTCELITAEWNIHQCVIQTNMSSYISHPKGGITRSNKTRSHYNPLKEDVSISSLY